MPLVLLTIVPRNSVYYPAVVFNISNQSSLKCAAYCFNACAPYLYYAPVKLQSCVFTFVVRRKTKGPGARHGMIVYVT